MSETESSEGKQSLHKCIPKILKTLSGERIKENLRDYSEEYENIDPGLGVSQDNGLPNQITMDTPLYDWFLGEQ